MNAVMFDLDGTLADTLKDIHAAANHALVALEGRRIDLDRCRQLVGRGAAQLIRSALETADEDLVDEGVRRFKAHYDQHGLTFTRPYEGIDALLAELCRRDVPRVVWSNKPDPAVQQVVRHLFPDSGFSVVRGHRPGPGGHALKPEPAGALAICKDVGIAPAHWLYVGDTEIDMQTAAAAGFFAVGVLWGFRDERELTESGARVIIRHPREVLGLLE